MTKTTKAFNVLFLVIIAILTLMSLAAIVFIHWTFFDITKYSISITPIGINNYLSAYGNYNALFAATIATIAAYFGLLQLKDKLKQDRFSEWKTVLDIMFIEIEKFDPYMRREFTRVRYSLFRQLYNLNFNIENNAQLTQIFQTTFQDRVIFFETQNNKHIGMGGAYPTDRYSYSFNSFQFLLRGCFDNVYTEINNDLLNLYVANLPADRIIDAEMYQTALRNYNPI